jgi:hypothetical protein
MTFFKRLRCLFKGHTWSGYDEQPLGWITCKRCGLTP